jgi:glutamine synthetase
MIRRLPQGYFEDRRPSSNCDPYCVTEAIVRTVLLDVKKLSKSYTPQEAERLMQQVMINGDIAE